MSKPIEELLNRWAQWISGPGVEFSLSLPSRTWSRSAVERISGEADKPLTARGKETVSAIRTAPEKEDVQTMEKVDSAMDSLRRERTELWKVMRALYLGVVPGRRVAREDNGARVLRPDRVRRDWERGETAHAFQARLARRLLINESTFRNRVAMAHAWLEAWCISEGLIPKSSEDADRLPCAEELG